MKDKIVIDTNLISYLADAGENKNNPLSIAVADLKSLVNILLNHNKDNLDVFISSTSKNEIYSKGLCGHPKQLREVFMAAMLKGVDSIINKETFNINCVKLRKEFNDCGFGVKNENDFKILVESISLGSKYLVTYDKSFIKICKNNKIKQFIDVEKPVVVENLLCSNAKYIKYGAS